MGVTATPGLQAQVSSVRSTRDVISRLENEVPGLMKQGGVPGMSIALIRDGKTIWLHGFGVKDKKTGEPVGTDTVFEAASLSKPVFTYGVLKLVDSPYPNEKTGGAIMIIVGGIFLATNLGWVSWRIWELWPLILIGAGLLIVSMIGLGTYSTQRRAN